MTANRPIQLPWRLLLLDLAGTLLIAIGLIAFLARARRR
jgi:hypothetical protein